MRNPRLKSQQVSTLVRVVERRFGLSLLPALHAMLVKEAQRLVQTAQVASFSQIIAKLTVAPEQDVVIQAMRQAASIGETYFFRAPDQLRALADLVAEKIVPHKRGGQPLRVWSAACASGEEPYTLAILFKSRFPDLAVQVHASDMNPTALRTAEAGLYQRFSFREGRDAASLAPWLLETSGGAQVSPELRRMVSFDKLNLVTDAFPAPGRPFFNFDVIACRNVLIYIDPDKLPLVVTKLRQAAAPRSVLMFTPSEYTAARYAGDYRDRALGLLLREATAPLDAKAPPTRSDPPSPPYPSPPSSAHPPTAGGTPPPSAPRPGRSAEASPKAAIAPPPPSGPRADPGLEALLKDAELAADQGKFEEACRLTDRVLALKPDSGTAYCLRGLICASEGRNDRAVTSFERALFLDRSLIAAELGLGQALARLGRPGARPHLERAVRLLEQAGPGAPVRLLNVSSAVARRVAENALEGLLT